MKSFSITFRLDVDEEANLLSLYEGGHEQDVRELVENVFYDIDDININNIKIQER
tara:strand:- start:5 stop:169 length:165 start_codon:yes stop_codon:yes gene_type:complete